MTATIEATEKPQPTQASVPAFPAGFASGPSIVPDAREGWESAVFRVGGGGPAALVKQYRELIEAAGEKLKGEHADAIRTARDAVAPVEVDRLRALLTKYESALPELERAKESTDKAARAAAVAGEGQEAAEHAARRARDEYEDGARRIDATKAALGTATKRLAEDREAAAQKVKQELRSELDAAARAMAADIANTAAPKLAALTAVRTALAALKQ